MNVYDFDKTIYDGDSATDFFKFSLKKNPKMLLKIKKLPFSYLRYKLNKISRTTMKESLYRYVTTIENLDEEVREFWQLNQHKIKKWYLQTQRPDDLIISASPSFLIQPICQQLNLNWIASPLDTKTGTYNGPHCWGDHKVMYYRKYYQDKPITNFYSDHISDTPMARLAKEAWFVTGDDIKPWSKQTLNDTTTKYL